MPKQPKEKSPHLQGLEAVFERHTRRFSPFDILGLRASVGESTELEGTKIDHGETPTHIGVDATHPPDPQTHIEVGATPLPGVWIHPRVVEVQEDLTNNSETHVGVVPPTHIVVDATHPHVSQSGVQASSTLTEAGIHEV